MTNTVVIVVLGALAVVLERRRRQRKAEHVTPSWLVDNERRRWTVGIDQVGFRGRFFRRRTP